jgi:predicted Fe-S protein YdhL (DUF1289 family)
MSNQEKRMTDRERRLAERRRLLSSGPPSPCIGVCKIGDDGLCMGCVRTIDEIRNWSIMMPDQRHQALVEIQERKNKEK